MEIERNNEVLEMLGEVDRMTAKEIDEALAKELLGFKKSALFHEMKNQHGELIANTNWLDASGKPVLMPPITQVPEVALFFMNQLGFDIQVDFVGDTKMFGARVVDAKLWLNAKTFPFAIGKALLFAVRLENYNEAKGE